MAKRIRIEVAVPEADHVKWAAEAERRGMTVERWLQTVANFVIAAEVEGERVGSLGRRRMLADVAMTCALCGSELSPSRTIRKQYCSDECRVAAWRMRQRSDLAQSQRHR
jgi:hypothetical protein